MKKFQYVYYRNVFSCQASDIPPASFGFSYVTRWANDVHTHCRIIDAEAKLDPKALVYTSSSSL